MTPQTKSIEEERVEEVQLQEQFVAQVEDHSRPAQEVLTDQQERRDANEATALFIP